MRSAVIADTSSLILFEKINEQRLLREIYGKLYITPEIQQEYRSELPTWIEIKEVEAQKYLFFLSTQVDLGEASAIALALEMENSLIILDDLSARKLALQLHLQITGVLGVLVKAKKINLVKTVKPLIDKLLQTNFRISGKIITEVLTITGEL